MHGFLKRMAAWRARWVTGLLTILIVFDLALFLPICIGEIKPSSKTRLWTLAVFFPGLEDRGPRIAWRGFDYVLLHGRWTNIDHSEEATALDLRLPPNSPDRVHLRPSPRSAVIGLLAPCILWTQEVRAVRMFWLANLDDPEDVPEPIRTAVLRAHAADQYGDPALARHLPDGGVSRFTPMALGLIHDPVFFATLTLIVVRCRHRRAIKRLNSMLAWRARTLACPQCRYDRTGLTHLPCPECGWGAAPTRP